MNILVAILSFTLALFFSYNFSEIIKKIKTGKQINKLSLLATSSLIIHFISIALYFIFQTIILVFISEMWMLFCLIYIYKIKN